MTAGPAAGRVLADLVGGAPEVPELSPARFRQL
jgi:glycine/D-amino acid oxidase-like deaminating enzyme